MAPQSAGALLAAFGLAGMISRIVLTPLAARSRAEARLLFGLLLAAALAVLLLRQMAAGESWRPWTAAVGMGLSAVATNAIAMGLLLRSPAFGPTAIASGQLSAAFFGGFALGPLGFGAIAAAAGGFAAAWQALTAVLLAGAALAAWLARQRPEQP
ncbi:hypothetical protein [Chitinimonas koreensis]|nr:hypothetical protein [Chitinimonas koreensis]